MDDDTPDPPEIDEDGNPLPEDISLTGDGRMTITVDPWVSVILLDGDGARCLYPTDPPPDAEIDQELLDAAHTSSMNLAFLLHCLGRADWVEEWQEFELAQSRRLAEDHRRSHLRVIDGGLSATGSCSELDGGP